MTTIRAIYENGQIRLLDDVELLEGQEVNITIPKSYHVVPHKKGWAIKSSGDRSTKKITNSKQEAERIAREMASEQGIQLIIHSDDNRTVPKPSSQKRIFGLHRGSMQMTDDFDDPLPDSFWLGDDDK